MKPLTAKGLASGAVIAAALLGLPLLGILLADKPLGDYLEFPPLTQHVHHSGFSWLAFTGLAIAILAVILPFDYRVLLSRRRLTSCTLQSEGTASRSSIFNIQSSLFSFPRWGWFGLALGAVAWILAWTRFSWFEPFQRFTFSPLWLAYIIVINALTYRRTGHCMLKDRPQYLLALFVASAAFWWFFEYLNRFVQNWYYEGVAGLTPVGYFVFATLPFSTVLPAVLGTYEWLDSRPSTGAGLDSFIRIDVRHTKTIAWLSLLGACTGMACVGVWPDYLFPLLWIAPLVVMTSLQAIRGQSTIFAPIRFGCWRRLYLLAMAALICGFFWEMWNAWSLAKWKYSVPFVGELKIFEMPILGFAGYLPFGLECAVIGDLVAGLLSRSPAPRPATVCKWGNCLILIALSAYFLIIPGFLVIRYVADPAVSGPGIPKIAWRLHRTLTRQYEPWARKRIASQKAAQLHIADVPSTEWPMFGSVYYLWATEALQAAWEKDHAIVPCEPRIYARPAIDAATDLILDPVHHTWVMQHWGKDYLHTQNIFFRTLLVAGMTSHERLIGSKRHLPMLRDQVETMSAILDTSPRGVLEDYPGECYPVDVFAAVACIRRADVILGTDHSQFAARELRAFQGAMLDERGLIPYSMNYLTGKHYEPSRGIGNSFILIFAPELYPEQASQWYGQYKQHFWQERMLAAGWREYPRNYHSGEWTYDVDAGPVINGYGPAANAFGVAAARANGRLDDAYTLSAQVIAACWPLPDGSMLGPKILSNMAHAPYLGEACMLFMLTVQPVEGVPIITGGRLPGMFYVGLLFFFGLGALMIISSLLSLHRWRRNGATVVIRFEKAQFLLWICLLTAGVLASASGHLAFGISCILVAQLFPRGIRDGLDKRTIH